MTSVHIPARHMKTPSDHAQRRLLASRVVGAFALGFTAILLAAYYGYSPNFRVADNQNLFGGDYFQEWFGGRLVTESDLASYYDPARAESLQHDPQFTGLSWESPNYFPLVYPPFHYAIASPLSNLPYRQAACIWAALMTACYLIAAVMLARHFLACGPDWLAPYSLAILPIGLAFAPIAESLLTNQKGTLCLLIVCATFLFLHRDKPFAAGLSFGWLFFKPQLALPIMLVMLWKRQWWFTAGLLTTLSLLMILALTTGTDACWQYLQFIGQAPQYIYNAGYSVSRSHCLDSFFHGLLEGHETIARSLAVIGTLFLAGFALWVVRGPLRFDSHRFGLQFSSLILITVLISPHLYAYDLSLLLLPFVLILSITWRLRASTFRKATHYLLLALYSLVGVSESLAEATGVQLSVILMVTLLVVLATWAGTSTSQQGVASNQTPHRPAHEG